MSNTDIPRDCREDKLPIWAQKHLDILRMRLAEVTKDRDEALGGQKIDGSGDCEPSVILDVLRASVRKHPVDTPVRFILAAENGNYPEYVDVSIQEGSLVVRASDPFVIQPQASNHVRIDVIGVAKRIKRAVGK